MRLLLQRRPQAFSAGMLSRPANRAEALPRSRHMLLSSPGGSGKRCAPVSAAPLMCQTKCFHQTFRHPGTSDRYS